MNYNSLYNLIGINQEIKRLQKQVNLGWEKEFRILKWLGLEDGMEILDLGGGPGFFSELLLENLPNSKVTLLEPDADFMKFAKENLSKYNDRISFIEESIYNNTLKQESYDFVVSRFVFQHLDEPIVATKEIYRVLKYGGIVTIIDSDRGVWGISDPDILKSERNILARLEKRTRWNREVGRKLLKILRTVGFKGLDFEAVAIHSDIVGINNMVGEMNFTQDDIKNLSMINPKLASLLKQSKDIINSKNTIILLINLIAKGVKQ